MNRQADNKQEQRLDSIKVWARNTKTGARGRAGFVQCHITQSEHTGSLAELSNKGQYTQNSQKQKRSLKLKHNKVSTEDHISYDRVC